MSVDLLWDIEQKKMATIPDTISPILKWTTCQPVENIFSRQRPSLGMINELHYLSSYIRLIKKKTNGQKTQPDHHLCGVKISWNIHLYTRFLSNEAISVINTQQIQQSFDFGCRRKASNRYFGNAKLASSSI